MRPNLQGARNLCFVCGEYMFQKKLIPAKSEWDRVVDATRQVGKHAVEKRIELAIELLPFEFAFVNSLSIRWSAFSTRSGLSM